MAIWVTSDEHYGHGNIIAHCNRPFTDRIDMREQLIARHNAVVAVDDTVWHLGDFSFARPDETTRILQRLHGEHHLVLGNHDRSATQMLAIGFCSVGYVARLDFAGLTVTMRHLPPGDHGDSRKYADKFYAHVDDGFVILCGHVHDKWVRSGKNVFNVGVDVRGFAPVRLDLLMLERGREVPNEGSNT